MLYMVGQTVNGYYDFRKKEYIRTDWDFQGIFDDKEKAESICKNQLWFVVPVKLNEEYPEETISFDEYTPNKKPY